MTDLMALAGIGKTIRTVKCGRREPFAPMPWQMRTRPRSSLTPDMGIRPWLIWS
jgi:hypothetical protein